MRNTLTPKVPKRRSAPLALALSAALVLSACGKGDEAKPADGASAAKPAAAASAARPALSVSVAAPEMQNWPLTLAANGNVVAWQEASVGSESNGLRLAEVRVNVGDVVQPGQVLAVFAGDTVRADVAQAQASLAEA